MCWIFGGGVYISESYLSQIFAIELCFACTACRVSLGEGPARRKFGWKNGNFLELGARIHRFGGIVDGSKPGVFNT